MWRNDTGRKPQNFQKLWRSARATGPSLHKQKHRAKYFLAMELFTGKHSTWKSWLNARFEDSSVRSAESTAHESESPSRLMQLQALPRRKLYSTNQMHGWLDRCQALLCPTHVPNQLEATRCTKRQLKCTVVLSKHSSIFCFLAKNHAVSGLQLKLGEAGSGINLVVADPAVWLLVPHLLHDALKSSHCTPTMTKSW